MRKTLAAPLALAAALGPAPPSAAQFTHRYPKVAGYTHHIYLEGYELPVLNAGPGDPAVAPDGRGVAVSARGWLWLVDLETRVARRLTRGPAMDFRPAFSPDGKRVAFVRDTGKDTSIVLLDLASGQETIALDTPALDLDPAFTPDGRGLLVSSAEAGDFDLWQVDLGTGGRDRLTVDAGLELAPRPSADGRQVVLVSKQRGGQDAICSLDLGSRQRRVVREEGIGSQMRPALSADGRRIAVSLPSARGWSLHLLDPAGGPTLELTPGARLPLSPAFTPDGRAVYYVEADARQRFHLYRVGAFGGPVEDVSPLRWDWGEAAGRVAIRTWAAGDRRPLPVRLAVTDRDGHPLLPDDGQPRFDSQGGRTYVYSPGWLELTVPAGEVRVTATHGFAFPALGGAATVAPGGAAVVEIEYPALAEPRRDGWYSGDHHWHLNYGGPYPLRPEDVLTLLEAEDLDVATPQVANHHTRLLDQEYWSWRRLERPPLVAFAQEVRSHFLGHLGLMGLSSPYWPWYWGPGYPALAQEDLANAEALAHARRQGGFGWYVHPVTPRDPFPAGAEPSGIPLELVPDAVLGDLDGVEVACLWSDEMGTSALWHRLLNLGLAVVPTAGTDAFPNFFRTMAVGATRVYVKPDGPLTMESYLAALKAGRSYVTNGPLLTFTVDGRGPGDVIEARAGGEVAFSLEVASAVTVESVEVLVNGRAAFTSRGPRGPGVLSSRGRLRVPPGGWISARAHGGATAWPAMDSYPFAHTAPVWVGRKGSRDPAAAAEAARDLLRWMDVAERRLAEAYAEGQDLKARFAQARRVLARAAAGRP